jgi:hypothetical protein
LVRAEDLFNPQKEKSVSLKSGRDQYMGFVKDPYEIDLHRYHDDVINSSIYVFNWLLFQADNYKMPPQQQTVLVVTSNRNNLLIMINK